ncbi:MAG: serine/threonine protein phosphatase [Bacteroidia bacterium]|nr:serine/threonine protein phosphatase [Bacteroidia bacterium]
MSQGTPWKNTFVIGDIHGAHRALQQCLQRSGFDYEHDRLIALGDVCDGWPDTRDAIDALMRIRHLVYLLGNHDYLALQWMKYGVAEDLWLKQGGRETIASYQYTGVPESHIQFLDKAHLYFLEDNKLFVHAGIKFYLGLEQQDHEVFLWDRELVQTALYDKSQGKEAPLTSYDEIYVGHTVMKAQHPVHACEVWMMDTGAGWSGVLSMMNVETKQIFQSDPVPQLYPGVQGRKAYRG